MPGKKTQDTIGGTLCSNSVIDILSLGLAPGKKVQDRSAGSFFGVFLQAHEKIIAGEL
jgi:hypothetical protein